MKKILIILSLFLISCNTQQEKSDIVKIEGNVLSGQVKEVNFKYLQDNPIVNNLKTWTAKVDSLSHFSIEIPLKKIAIGRIQTDKYNHEICLMPGDDINITIDGDSINYTGKRAEKNNFLYNIEKDKIIDNQLFIKAARGRMPIKTFCENKKKERDCVLSYLKKYENPLDTTFLKLYKINTQILYENNIMYYTSTMKRMSDTISFPQEYKSIYNININDKYLISNEYLRNIESKISYRTKEIKLQTPEKKRSDIYNSLVNDSLSGKTKEYLLCKDVLSDLAFNIYDTVAIKRLKSVMSEDLVKETFNEKMAKYNEKQALLNKPFNKEFSQTQLTDTSGNELTFGELMTKFKGEVVFVDFWQLGCGGCMMAMPYSIKLKAKLKDVPVEFVYLYTGNFDEKILPPIYKITSTKKNQYSLKKGFENSIYNYMNIYWIPCYMIFDKEGNLINFRADHPSKQGNKKLEKQLRELAEK